MFPSICLNARFRLNLLLVVYTKSYWEFNLNNSCVCCDSSVGIALGYGLDYRGSRVRFPAGVGNFSLHYRVQNGSGAHPASYPMGTKVFPWG
jgi:hypothetical protein